MLSKQALVCLVGRKGSGKDTGAAILLDKGFMNVKFADGLKVMLRSLLAYQGADPDTIERMIEGDLKEIPTDYLGGNTPRYAMQTLGTEWGRTYMGEDFWASIGLTKARGQDTVITDGRFPNEVALTIVEDGIVIGISADWINPTEGEHVSEAKIDEIIASLPAHRVVRNSKTAGCDPNASIAAFKARLASSLVH